MNDAERNFRWAYQLLLALAKRHLAEENECRQNERDWPVGQLWDQLSNSSREIFLRRAREEAGIPHEEFLNVVRSGEVDVSDLYDQA